MVEREQIIKEKAEIEGVFDFKAVYSFAHSWLKDKNYGVNEDRYEEKVTGNSKNIRIEWEAVRPFSDYFKFNMKLGFQVNNMTDVEVEIDGEKKSMNKGKITVEIRGILLKDPKSKWENSAFQRFLRDVYNKYVVPQRIDDMESLLMSHVRELKDEIKAVLDLSGKR